MAISYTNSSLACARRCLTEYDFRYNLRMERVRDDEREALAVGEAWHKAHEAKAQDADPYGAIAWFAPSALWAVKLSRLFAAHEWYWRGQPFEVIAPEFQFELERDGFTFRGRIDAVIKLPDGRTGVLEHKTTSENLEAESLYWNRLRMNVQVGLYALALDPPPSFILYDVVRKPTINPKRITEKERKDLYAHAGILAKHTVPENSLLYYGERIDPEEFRLALDEHCAESNNMYGARLTSDIGNRPEHYFARREVPRTEQDYATLIKNLTAQIRVLQFAEQHGLMHRNPDACAQFGICDYFGLCSNNVRPTSSAEIPDGYTQRSALHPELDEPGT